MSLRHPPYIEWEVTPECNHNCVHCYNYWRRDNDSKIVSDCDLSSSEQYYLKLADRIIESKPVSVTITGGEPLLVFEQVKSSIIKLLNAGINVSVNTNATLVTEDIASFFAENAIRLFVSFPSADPQICDEITNTYNSVERISNGIRLLMEKGVQVATNVVVSKINLPSLYTTAAYLKNELGQDYFCATRACLPSNAGKDFLQKVLDRDSFLQMVELLFRIRDTLCMKIDSARSYSICSFNTTEQVNAFCRFRGCGAGKTAFVVTYDGDIKACAMDCEIYGNILTEPFSSAISRMEIWQDKHYYPSECQQCHLIENCSGGCRVDAMNTFGERNLLDSLSDSAIANSLQISLPSISFDDHLSYCLSNDITTVEEDGFLRVSSGNQFLFITGDALQMFTEMGEFDIHKVIKSFSIDLFTAKNVMNSLFEAKIIVPI